MKKDFGLTPEKIQKIRKECGLTLPEAGEFISGSKTGFKKYEKGTRKPKRPTAVLFLLLEKFPALIEDIKSFYEGVN